MYPHERSLVQELATKPFALIGVNSDKLIETARAAVKDKSLNWRSFWAGPKGGGGPIPAKWNVRGWPTVVLIDHDGIIRFRGNRPNDELLHRLVGEAEQAQKKKQR